MVEGAALAKLACARAPGERSSPVAGPGAVLSAASGPRTMPELPGDIWREIFKWRKLLRFNNNDGGWKMARSGEVWWKWTRNAKGEFNGTMAMPVSDWERDMLCEYHTGPGPGDWNFSTPIPRPVREKVPLDEKAEYNAWLQVSTGGVAPGAQ